MIDSTVRTLTLAAPFSDGAAGVPVLGLHWPARLNYDPPFTILELIVCSVKQFRGLRWPVMHSHAKFQQNSTYFWVIDNRLYLFCQVPTNHTELENVSIANALQLEAARATPALSPFNYDAMPSLMSPNLAIAVL